MNEHRRLFSAICLLFTLVTANSIEQNDSADATAVKSIERTDGAFPQRLSTAALNSAEAVVIGKLTRANLVRMAKSKPPIYSFNLHLSVEEVLRGEVKVGAQLQLGHSAKQVLSPAYPVGKRVLVAVKFSGGARAHAIALATDEALVAARAALSASGESVSDADHSIPAEQDGADQPATAPEPEPKPEGDSEPEPESEGRSQ